MEFANKFYDSALITLFNWKYLLQCITAIGVAGCLKHETGLLVSVNVY